MNKTPVRGEDGESRFVVDQARHVTESMRDRHATAAARKEEARSAFQLRLADALRLLGTPREVQMKACEMLGEHLGVNRVHFAEIEGDEFVIRASYVTGVAPFRDRGPIATFGAALLESFRYGETVAVDDVARDPRFTPVEGAALRAAGVVAFAGVMLMREGRWDGSLGVHSATPRAWTADDLATISAVADRIWTAVERARADAALRESEARYAAIFEGSPIGKALTRWSDRMTVSANPSLLRMLGFTAEEVVGRTSVDLGIATAEEQAQVRAALEAHGSVRDFECRRVARSGETRILSLNLDWVFVSGERHILTTIRDLTDLRKAEENAREYEKLRAVDRARAETLRRSEAKYSGILETSADGVVSVDAQQRITLFNKTAEQTFSYTRDEVLGAPLDILLPERLRSAHREHVARFASGGDASRMMSERSAQLFGRRKNGEEFPFEATISKVTVDGEMVLTAAVRDITAKLRSEIEERLLSEVGRTLSYRIDEDLALETLTRLAVLEFADLSALFLVAEDGSIQRHGVICRDPTQQWFCELMMGLPVDRRSQHPLWAIVETRRSALVQLDLATAVTHALSEEHKRALETLRPRSAIGVPLLAGDHVTGVLFVTACWPSRAFDDRDLRLMEEIARRAALSLENARLYRVAQSAIRARDEVLSIVAHDLRSPLHAISLYTAAGRQRPGGLPDRRSPRSADAISRSVSHMSRMINDLLDVATMESGHLDLDRAGVAPAVLLADAVEAHRERAAQCIELRAEAAPGLPQVWADKGRVLQVFENLIGNALRVTPHGSISLAAVRRDDEILFSVTDTGPGIAPDDLAHVFDRFWQARTSRRGGAGLGLAIVKGIIEAHGGRAWFESKLGAGTTVFFTLPRLALPTFAAPSLTS